MIDDKRTLQMTLFVMSWNETAQTFFAVVVSCSHVKERLGCRKCNEDSSQIRTLSILLYILRGFGSPFTFRRIFSHVYKYKRASFIQ